MPETITREQLNEAINEFADKIMEALGVTAVDEETGEPESPSTCFKAINTDGDEVTLDAEYIGVGAVVVDGAFEYFRCCENGETGPWVRYSGESYDHVDFARKMRFSSPLPRIAHAG